LVFLTLRLDLYRVSILYRDEALLEFVVTTYQILKKLIISRRKSMQTPMPLEVNIASATNYNSKGSSRSARGVRCEISGSGVVEQTRSLEQYQEFYRSDPLLRSFIESAPHAIIVTDDKGVIRSCNPFAEKLFGYTEVEVFGKAFSTLAGRPHLGRSTGGSIFCSEPSPSKSVPNNEAKARKKSGELCPVEIVSNQLVLDESPVYVHFIRDVSFRLRFEKRISELQQELIHLSQTNVLGELASAITHELNQPLTAITNYAAAAKQCGCKASPEDLESSFALMDKAASQAKRAWQIMHKLRKLVQHRGAECTNCDLRATLEDAVQLATLGTSHHRIQVTLDMPASPVMVLMDRVQIQILLTNLVRNAVDELNTWDGERKVRVMLQVCPDKTAAVSVEDTGPGIAPEVFESIFDPFHTTKPDGLGMGLSICRRIAEAHDGRLSAANRAEGGAVFSFIVPMSSEILGE
jgi:two-component system, LuxR family, sensor kinase FixL